MFRLLASFLTVIAALQAQAALPANCDRNATVVAGDTCDLISAQYSVSTYQLAAVNTQDITANCDNLYVGEVVCLGLTGQDCQTTHVVKRGDTCVGIMDTYNISMSTLLANNPNLNRICTNLYPNEVLCVSSQIYVILTQPA